jgi:D-threo-aldose 1-dehydrogenase
MREREIRTGVRTTELGFGAAPIGNYGRPISDAAAMATLQRTWDLGVRYYDTAPLYGTGLSERRVGSFLAELPRDGYAVSTKVGRLVRPNPSPSASPVNEYNFHVPDDPTTRFDFSAAAIRRSVEESLERIGVDRLDIALIHDPDDHAEQALAEAYPELERMRAEGIVAAIGLGINQWELPLRFVQETDVDVVMLAGRYTLADQSGSPLLDECAERGVAVLAAAPFNSGLLARDEVPDAATFNYSAASDQWLVKARAIRDICNEFGVPLPTAALRYPLLHPAVVSVVPGLRTIENVETAVAALDATIPDEMWAALRSAGLIR